MRRESRMGLESEFSDVTAIIVEAVRDFCKEVTVLLHATTRVMTV